MRIASVNLRRGLRRAVAHGRLGRWLADVECDVLCVQEVSASQALTEQHRIPDFDLVDGDGSVATFARSGLAIGHEFLTRHRWQTVRVGSLSLHNVYLSARSAGERTKLLDRMARTLAGELRETHLVVGDFNLAPRPEDGLSNGRPSRFNTLTERQALGRLLKRTNLSDLGVHHEPGSFTREVNNGHGDIRFRCDLALLSRSCFDSVSLSYDHTVRNPELGFTDHSALIVELPIDPLPPGEVFIPGNTAKPRSVPSRIARDVVPVLAQRLRVRSILDFGCGRGRDLEHYRSLGYDAAGYDAHHEHGFPVLPERHFDLVVMTYVLNTLPEPGARTAALVQAFGRLRRRGVLAVAVRDWTQVAQDARARGWPKLNDGYLTSAARRTFVKGMGRAEVLACLPSALSVDVLDLDLPRSRGSEVVLIRRR